MRKEDDFSLYDYFPLYLYTDAHALTVDLKEGEQLAGKGRRERSLVAFARAQPLLPHKRTNPSLFLPPLLFLPPFLFLPIHPQTGDKVLYLPLRRGDVTVHDERVVHGSG